MNPGGDGKSRRTVTIYDVAEHAGVGIATVSRALHGSAPVAEKTRERVLAAVAELGFRQSHSGTSLAQRRHAANGIVFPDLSGPYYAEVLLGYEEAASQRGRSVLVLATRGRSDAESAVRDLAGRVDGLVLLGRTVDDAFVAELTATGLPVVLVARPGVEDSDSIGTDGRAAARLLGEHLASHRPDRVTFVGSTDDSPDVVERWRGVHDALARHDIDLSVAPCRLDESSGTRVATELLGGTHPPDVLVCANDEIALGAIVAAEGLGLAVGRDVAITGWDDVMAARHARPALTTVRQPMRSLGAVAAEALDERITGSRTTPRHESLTTDLVVRDSCGPHA